MQFWSVFSKALNSKSNKTTNFWEIQSQFRKNFPRNNKKCTRSFPDKRKIVNKSIFHNLSYEICPDLHQVWTLQNFVKVVLKQKGGTEACFLYNSCLLCTSLYSTTYFVIILCLSTCWFNRFEKKFNLTREFSSRGDIFVLPQKRSSVIHSVCLFWRKICQQIWKNRDGIEWRSFYIIVQSD